MIPYAPYIEIEECGCIKSVLSAQIYGPDSSRDADPDFEEFGYGFVLKSRIVSSLNNH